MTDFSRLKRPRHVMPGYVRRALAERGLANAYTQRPAYKQNDYVGWIVRAKRDETKRRRLHQMLDELAAGNVYMKMPHRAKRPRTPQGPEGDSVV